MDTYGFLLLIIGAACLIALVVRKSVNTTAWLLTGLLLGGGAGIVATAAFVLITINNLR